MSVCKIHMNEAHFLRANYVFLGKTCNSEDLETHIILESCLLKSLSSITYITDEWIYIECIDSNFKQ